MSDKISLPRFQLQRVYDDGSREEPELHALHGIDISCRMGRRGFLLTSAVGVGLLAALSTGCDADPVPETTPDFKRYRFGTVKREISSPNVLGITAHQGRANSVAFSPDGTLLATTGDDKSIKLWSLRDGSHFKKLEGRQVLKGDKERIMHAAFTPDGKRLISETDEGALHFWSMPDGALQTTLKREKPLTYVPFRLSPNGVLLATKDGQNHVLVQDLSSDSTIGRLEHKNPVWTFAFNPEGTVLATGQHGLGSDANQVIVWDIPSLKKRIQRQQWVGGKLAFSADGASLLVPGNSREIDVLALPSAARHKNLQLGDKSHPEVMALTPDGKWLATRWDKFDILLTSMVFDPEESVRLLGPATGPGGSESGDKSLKERCWLSNLAFSPNSDMLAAATTLGSVHVWRIPVEGGDPVFHVALFDPETANTKISVRQGILKNSHTYVGSCGDPLPAGAVCTCNCVSGKIAPYYYDSGKICTCDQICTCVPVK